jgi:hypothetical protein
MDKHSLGGGLLLSPDPHTSLLDSPVNDNGRRSRDATGVATTMLPPDPLHRVLPPSPRSSSSLFIHHRVDAEVLVCHVLWGAGPVPLWERSGSSSHASTRSSTPDSSLQLSVGGPISTLADADAKMGSEKSVKLSPLWWLRV